MRQSRADRRIGLLQTLAAFLLGLEDKRDERPLDTYRGFHDPNQEVLCSRRASFSLPGHDCRPI